MRFNKFIKYQCCAVNVPWMADIQKEFLKDIAAVTGAFYVDNNVDLKLVDVQLEHLGGAERIDIGEWETMITGAMGKRERIVERCEIISGLLSSNDVSENMKKIHKVFTFL